MKEESIVIMGGDRKGRTWLGSFIVLATVVMLMPAPIPANSAGPGGKSDTLKFEEIPGSTLKRVILSEKATERLGIETGEVSEKPIIRNQIVGGRVIPPVKNQPEPAVSTVGFGSFGQLAKPPAPKPVLESTNSPSDGEAWIVVSLSAGEWDRLRKDMPARIFPLSTRDNSGGDLFALPSGREPIQDFKRSMLTVYYRLPGNQNGLKLYNRVRVELPVTGTDEKRMVVPYAALYYDAEGTAWVYVNPKPLVFERHRIVVDHVVGDLAVLKDGPPVGTKVVTVGAALLYGAEVVFRK